MELMNVLPPTGVLPTIDCRLPTVVRALIDIPALSKAMKLRPDQKIILAQSVGYPKTSCIGGCFFRISLSASVLRQKFLSFNCHSGLDPESSLFNWIPAFAGMTATELM